MICGSKEVASAVNGTLTGGNFEFQGCEIDTRRDVHGKIFFALDGENTDGHLFIKQAIDSGCAAVVVSKQVVASVPVIQVENTRHALFLLAAYFRTCIQPITTIAITGSVGKTTTKDLVAKLLGKNTTASPASFNNELGIPLTILDALDSNNVVVEIGASACGEIETLTKLANPDIAIITSIQKAHLEGFGSIEAIFQEKMKLFESLSSDGIAIVPLDVGVESTKLDCELVTVGESNNADVRIRTRCDKEGFAMLDIGTGFVTLKVLGKHNAMNAALAIVAAQFAFRRQGEEYSIQDLLDKISTFEGAAGRLMKEEIHGLTVIDDAYNANPASMRAAIEMFSSMSGTRKILVLGDMLELGDQCDVEHRRIGGLLVKQSFDQIILVGEAMACAAKLLPEAIYEKNYCDQTMLRIAHSIQNGDTVLLKGSRGMQLERIAKYLRDMSKVSLQQPPIL